MITTDVIIIGAGPVGLFSIFTCGMMRLKVHVIDALDVVGGQCTALYPEKPIYDIPGFPNITAQQLVDRLREQAAPFEPVFHLKEKVTDLLADGESGWILRTTARKTFQAKTVIIAAGAGAFGPNRPPLDHLERFEGHSVFYRIQRAEDFRDKRVVIAGGGDSAVDWALILADIAKSVSIVHRRAQFRAAPESLHQLQTLATAGQIELVTPYQLDALEGDETYLQMVWVKTLTGERRGLPADILLPFFGLSYDLGPLASWGLTLDQKHICVDPGTTETNLPGVYGVGDIATYPHKRKLILTGFSEAAQAAQAIRSRLFPDKTFHFEYSTTSGVPQAC